MGAATRAHPFFGMTTTKTLRSVFLWHSYLMTWSTFCFTAIKSGHSCPSHPHPIPSELNDCGTESQITLAFTFYDHFPFNQHKSLMPAAFKGCLDRAFMTLLSPRHMQEFLSPKSSFYARLALSPGHQECAPNMNSIMNQVGKMQEKPVGIIL